jgi:hypothetical protein
VNGGKPGSRSKKIIYRNNSYGTPAQSQHMQQVHSKMDYLHVYPGKLPSSSPYYFFSLEEFTNTSQATFSNG